MILAERGLVRRIPPSMRERLVELHRVDARVSATRIAFYLLLWGGGAAIACTPNPFWLRVCAWVLIGLCLHGLGDFMHMCSHGRVFGRGWVDRLVGFLCGAAVLLSCSCYRAHHIMHHRYLNSARDPDYLGNIPTRRLRRLIFYAWFLVGLPIYTIRLSVCGPFMARGWREKALCVLETVAMVKLYFFLSHFWPIVQNAWVKALPFAIVLANMRGLAEHTMLEWDNAAQYFRGTRTTISNRLVSFFFNNQNYHLEHHLFPSVPWHNLPAVHRLLVPMYVESGAAVLGGYTEFVTLAVERGP